MSRWLSAVVLLAFCAGLVLLFLQAHPSLTSACCRRDGKHHCMMSMAGMGTADDGSTSVRTVPEPCSYRSQWATLAGTAQPQGPLAFSDYLPRMARVALPELQRNDSRLPSSTSDRGPPRILFATNR
jgi:hypothetical protein